MSVWSRDSRLTRILSWLAPSFESLHLRIESPMRRTAMNLSFHQTFPPERDCLARLLELASDMPPMTKEQISQVTGIPTGTSSGKVEPHIQYAEFMGLICDLRSQGLHCLTRTALGEQIYLSDPFLSEPLSQLLCHANICREYRGRSLALHIQ